MGREYVMSFMYENQGIYMKILKYEITFFEKEIIC